jgi:hypothetical protein
MQALEAIRSLCRRGRWLLVTLIFPWVTGPILAEAPQESALWKRLVREAPPAWERYRNHWVTLEGSNHTEMKELYEGKWIISPRRSTWKQCGNNVLEHNERLVSQSWQGHIWGENLNYKFELSRKDETKPWVIVRVEQIEQPQDNVEPRRKVADGLLLFTPGGPIGLPEMLQSAAFGPTDIAPESGGKSEELVRVTFRYSPEDKKTYPQGGLVVVILDPSHDWVLRKAEVEVEIGGGRKGVWKSTLRRDYKEDPEGRPIETRTELKSTFLENGQVSYVTGGVGELTLQQRKSIPESEFTLSAFGLPEPHWAKPKTRPWYLWLGIGGIVCLALGAGAFWLKRRRLAGRL